ncbi:MAG TPA: HEAT repeat domain-containing protein [Aggregatilinea sp.]|uniref:HEAT repeat domain-containing protein n=1 Tax=Aggregatilinea sp. TaxID=2806333 RepID=UPI002B7FBDAF|nr:HEAT repeat domain-containing protein [Aggregatilinea sp.]HML24573.1 HEAT repeat domain-containing protein [Aggregatilinea sp.]
MAAPAREELVERLHDSKARVRRQAVRKLAATRDPSVIPLLRTAYMSDEDDSVRDAAHEGLSMFRAMESGGSSRSFPVSDVVLSRALRVLLILFVVSLLANGVLIGINALGGDGESDETTTPRTELIDAFSVRLDQAAEDAKSLRAEIEHHNETDEVVCAATFSRPEPYLLSDADRSAYSDLAAIADSFNPALTELQQAQAAWDTICQQQTASLIQGIEALKHLDHVEAVVDATRVALDTAMQAPVFTPTPPPTATSAQPDISATESAVEPEAPATLEPGVTPTGAPPSAAPTLPPTPAPTGTPTITPTVTQTPLPYPNLDYDTILRQLSDRLVIVGDLQNSYQTGMIDYWKRALQGQAVSLTICTFPEWPDYFFWNDAQRAELERTDVADPELEQAVTFVNAGLDSALPARELFESSCQSQTLASTADQGLSLAEQAVSDFSDAQKLIEQIRGRP